MTTYLITCEEINTFTAEVEADSLDEAYERIREDVNKYEVIDESVSDWRIIDVEAVE
tara:strand:- start:54 stop:224 length:171 start_codon:yes stop_codon:yes gene_type:complete